MLLEVKHLSRHFGAIKAVNDLSFTVRPGFVCGFVGPNGAGKTTAMRIMASIDAPTRGDVLVDGESVVEFPEKTRPHVGFMPDSIAAYPNLTVEEYLDFFASSYRLRGKEKRHRLETIIEFMQLKELRLRRSNQLSKGMTQRLGLARTLVHDPPILILDEPAAGLDPRSRIQLRELMKLLASEGKGILVSSHILTELSEICDAVVIIEQGTLRASGTVTEIMTKVRPHTVLRIAFVRSPGDPVRFLSEQPLVAEVTGDGATVSVTFTGQAEEKAALLSRLVEADFAVSEFHAEEHSLEDIFLTVTDGDVQ